MSLIQEGIKKGLISFDDEQKYITYVYQNKKRNYSNPEEKVQAETFLKLILTYGYDQKRIRLFVPVTIGASVKEADIIVYNNDEHTEAHIVIECKKEDISESEFSQAISQAFSYAATGTVRAKYFGVTSRIKDSYFEIPDKEPKKYKSIPGILPFGVTQSASYKYVKGGAFVNGQQLSELEIVTEEDLTRCFKQAHQSLWGGGKLNPSEAFDELDKLIFCKIWDEKKARKAGEPYDFQLFSVTPKANETEEDIQKRENQELSDRVKALYEEGRKRDPEVFKDDIRLSPEKLRTVVEYLQKLNLGDTDLDCKGRAFETFMGSFFRGDFGQYFTPRQIVRFILEVLPIKHNSLVLDTSCGSGGFLLYALDKVRKEADQYYPNYETNPKEYNQHYQHWHNFAQNNLFGIEINEQIARVAKMNMIIHDDGHTNVIASDGLLDSEDLIKRSGNKGFKYNHFDFIITNPPFGSAIKQTEQAYMHQYGFAMKAEDWLNPRSKKTERESQSTEVLFIEQCHNFLVEGGYLAMVVPDGILTNSSLQYVRDGIEEKYRIVAVVSMPQTAFSAMGAGVKSSILFLKKYSQAITEKIQQSKLDLQENIKRSNDYLKLLDKIENNKKWHLKELRGFDNAQNLSGKALTDSEAYKEWKKSVTAEYNDQIEALKEALSDQYAEEKQKVIEDYPIFMAIAEDIGYDATGKLTNNNELEFIGKELAQFIEAIESGKDSFFLSLDVDKNKIFVTWLHELEERIDPTYYKDEHKLFASKLNSLKFPAKKLGHLSTVICGPFGSSVKTKDYSNSGTPLIRISDIDKDANLQTGKVVFINNKLAENLKAYKVYENDLLISQRGSLGLVSLVTKQFSGSVISANFIAVKKLKNILPDYLKTIFTLSIGNGQIIRKTSGQVQTKITTDDIKSILIPLPPKEIQENIVQKMDQAYAAKKQKELEAQQLLESIDDYLLGELGIELPEPEENTIQCRIFIRNLSDVSGDRCDPYYYKNVFLKTLENLNKSEYSIHKLKEIAKSIINGYDYRDFSDSGRVYLRVSNIRKNEFSLEDTKFIPEFVIDKDIALAEGDLLLTRKGSFGISVVVDKCVNLAIISSEIFRIRFYDFKNINSYYISAYLNSKAGQIYFDRIKTGAIMGHISQEALKEYPIIVPPLEKQIEISEYITAIRNQAKQLQQQAKTDLEKVKQEVEAMILGDKAGETL